MKRIRSANRKRKAATNKKLDQHPLERFQGFVDEIEGNKVYCRVKDENGVEFHLTSPRYLFHKCKSRPSGKILLGTLFTMDIYRKPRGIVVTTTRVTQSDIDEAKRKGAELAELLSQLCVDSER